ncbi:hypothetical protein [Methylicorpusculum sp.]|uniref:hypothetical protein n=1 Tax=Methylicorpusculum sp. TaxID=2713644 RepID=UPI00271EEF9A|nr:hypothetical protein [Methylicorpusculum sp.]MDO8845283.1 hypothetical protein [Methylicorpusculum sp.]
MEVSTRPVYLSLNGIPTNTPSNPDQIYFIREPQGTWVPFRGNLLHDIERECVQIHDAFAVSIFGDLSLYYEFLKICPPFVYEAGMNSESRLSKGQFEQLLGKLGRKEVNMALYLFDCRKLVSGIQECSKEVIQLQGEFYRALNLDEFFLMPSEMEENGIRWMTSPVVTNLHATLGFMYIRLHSLLDYITKLGIEIEKIKTDFSAYPRLASKKVQFGDRKQISIEGTKDTLFEDCMLVREIESVRNHVIHDGLLDDMPKAYKVTENGIVIEKFILFPDQSTEGRLMSFKNRCLFYSCDEKINLRLPHVVSEFQRREIVTLRMLLKILQQNTGDSVS